MQVSRELQSDEADRLRSSLLDWFDRNQRDLPWRDIEDPYAIWVSEVMLQQTRVTTVLDYYERWMRRFPDIGALADATLDEVLEMWAGLGYYRRARFLHEAARDVVGERGGLIPSTAAGLRELKGIGRYTAAAVASIAFGEKVAVLDGNVARVLTRLFAIPGDPRSTPLQKILWSTAEELVGPKRPGDFNQAMMELGATVCTPQNPSCLLCPIRASCQAFADGETSSYPGETKRVEQKPVRVQTAVVHRIREPGGELEYLLVRRPLDGLLGGLWEFPTTSEKEESSLEALLDGELGVATKKITGLGELVHLFSHLRMTLEVDSRRAVHAAQTSRTVQWVTREEMASVALSSAMRKVEALIDAD